MTARGADRFAYDRANCLSSATVTGVPTTSAYDGDGDRASQTIGGVSTKDAYHVAARLPLLLTAGARDCVHGAQGLAYAVDAANTLTVAHTDALGSVRALTDGAGTLLQTYQTDPIGVPTQTQGASSQPYRFTGQQQDGDGLVYLRARSDDPQSGRFLGRDPVAGAIEVPLTLNRYSYALNNPLWRQGAIPRAFREVRQGSCSEESELAR